MTFFSKYTPHAWLLAVALCAGCSFQPSNPAEETAPVGTWFLTPVQVVSSENTASDPVWALPNERTYRLKACVRDSVTSLPRIGEEIRLVSPTETRVERLDPEGCFYWAQSLDYLFLADETFGETVWQVQLGAEKQTLRLALNPWKDGTAGLVDLGHSENSLVRKLAPPEKALQAFRSVPIAGQSNLVVQSMETPVWPAPHQTDGASLLPATLRMAVVATHLGIDDKPIETALARGDLRFRGYLAEADAEGNETVVAVLSQPAHTSLQQGWLEVKAEFKALQPANPAHEKILYFELIPADSGAGVMPAFRRIALGSGQKIPEAVSAHTFQTLVVQTATVAPNATAKPAAAVPLFRVVSYRASRAAGAQVANNWQATAPLVFEVCLRPGFDLSPRAAEQLVGKPFEVRWSTASNAANANALVLAKVQDDGCVRWKQSIEYPFAAEETYWPGMIELKSRAPDFAGLRFDIPYEVNPWRSNEFVGWDTRELGPAPRNPIPGPGQLVIDEYTASHEGTWQHRVDRYLQLLLVRKVRFRLSPKLFRPYSFDHGASVRVDLPQGLRMQLDASFRRADRKSVSEGLEKIASDADYLSGFQTQALQTAAGVADALGGVAIPFIHLALWEARVQSRLALTAVGALVAPVPAVRDGLFNGIPLRNDQDGKILVEPEPVDAANSQANVLAPVEKTAVPYPEGTAYFVNHPWKDAPLKMYVDLLKTYAKVNLRQSTEVPSPETLDLATATQAAKALCPKSNAPSGANNVATNRAGQAYQQSAEDCLKQPLKYFHVSALRIVDNVKPETRVIKATHSTSEISATFFNERKFSASVIQGESNRTSFQVGTQARLGYDKNGNGATAFTTFLHDNQQYESEEGVFSQDWRNGNRGSNKTQLEKKDIELEIHGTYQNCMVVRPLPPAVTVFNAELSLKCGPLEEGTFSEFYYSFEDVANHYVSALIDTGDMNQRGWRKILRGQDSFQAFDRLLSDATRYFVLKKIESFHDGLEYTLQATLASPLSRHRLYQDGGVFPGVSDAVEYSDVQWSDLEIRQASDRLAQGLVDRGKRPALAARYAYCYATELAATVPHGEYRKNSESVNKYTAQLIASGTEARCKQFAEDPRWDKPEQEVKP
jgi:hypothetical protein